MSAAEPSGEPFPPEEKLLLACSRVCGAAKAVAQLAPTALPSLDWARFLRLAARHGVPTLVYRPLASALAGSVPADVLDTLRGQVRAVAMRNLTFARDLVQVSRQLLRDGVRVVELKGCVLAESVYGDLSLRCFSDLDLLVRRVDVAAVCGSLAGIGYGIADLPKGPTRADLSARHHCSLLRPGGAPIELHWSLAEPYFGPTLNVADVLVRAQSVRFGGDEIGVLCPEDLLIALSAHGAKHHWPKLSMVCDVAELARARSDMDWATVMARARGTGCLRMVLVALGLARDLLDAPLPAEVVRSLEADGAGRGLCEALKRDLWLAERPVDEASERMRFFPFHVRMRDRWSDRARHALRIAFMPSAEDCAHPALPNALYPLHYLFRPARLLAESGKAALARHCGHGKNPPHPGGAASR